MRYILYILAFILMFNIVSAATLNQNTSYYTNSSLSTYTINQTVEVSSLNINETCLSIDSLEWCNTSVSLSIFQTPTVSNVAFADSTVGENSNIYCPHDFNAGPNDYDETDQSIYTWYINGGLVSGVNSSELNWNYTQIGDVVSCGVTAFDGYLTGNFLNSTNNITVVADFPTYYVFADYLNETAIEVGSINVEQIGFKLWLINSTGSTGAIQRANIMDSLFYDQTLRSPNYENISYFLTSYDKDVGRQAYYTSLTWNSQDPTVAYSYYDGTFLDTTNNLKTSFWWYLYESFSGNTNSTLNTDTSIYELNNPADTQLQLYSQGQNHHAYFEIPSGTIIKSVSCTPAGCTFALVNKIARAIYLTTGNMTWVQTGSYTTRSSIDYLSEGVPVLTAFNEHLFISAKDDSNSEDILNFNVSIYQGSTLISSQSTSDGSIIFIDGIDGYIAGETYTILISSLQDGNYYTKTYTNYDTSNNVLNVLLSPSVVVYSSEFNYYNYSGQLYARNLEYSLNVTCPTDSTTQLIQFVNYEINKTSSLSCNNETSFIFSDSLQYHEEGEYNFTLLLNTSFLPLFNNEVILNQSIISDLNNPVIEYLNFSVVEGFNQPKTNVSLQCSDLSPFITYNITFNEDGLFYGNHTNNTLQRNETNLAGAGTNSVYGECSDMFGSTSQIVNSSVYFREVILIDEVTNDYFDVNNITSAILFFDDNSTSYNFKTAGTNRVNLTASVSTKIRIELLSYQPRDLIDTRKTRYIDITFFNDQIRVCANKDDVNHNENYFISSSEKAMKLKSVYANCYVAADYTRFAYQDALLLKAFTKTGPYNLYIYEDGQETLLSSLDGSIESFVNIDTLIFAQTPFNINVLRDTLNFDKFDSNLTRIYYKNLDDNNVNITLTITRLDTGEVVLTQSDFNDTNEFTLYFNYGILGVNDSTLFRATISKTTTSGETLSIKRYFNIFAEEGILNSAFAFGFSFILLIFGFTFTISRLTFSWFGFLICMAALTILSLAISTWYILMLQGMCLILLIYIIIMMMQQTYPTLQ